ncbi:Xylose isomerase domain protein TIM barrel [Candidatus Sulfotelmatobacter kueseliae]|uniref:Xylose isomerase domain protein TIM barrel n=1 Tax=Candidatus Sulfotelmatobacter kueseliae TaxID=2042962 RepID=A0A2U3KFD8_9BACT|nr:Xylose isomerase domain protein TIM barrel [Candidatus Sulfotelmatobacter kueseliae]
MTKSAELIHTALDSFLIELPSWGFADTGTRFGKFLQDSAATTLAEKFADAGQVHALTGVCPSVALHVLWDLPAGTDLKEVQNLSSQFGVRPGSINPNVFQDQEYKHGSLSNERAEVREKALQHILESVQWAKELGSRDLAPWFADGSNYPGTANIRRRKQWLADGLRKVHQALDSGQRLLIEYKPFEPAFYHTDVADWGMALLLARAAGPQARVLVDTGHHYQAQNIEQIVAWLLSEDMLGGFHFNDRRYADDDLTLGSIDPYQIFRIFAEIRHYEWETGGRADIAYMVDQSHNLKNKIEAMIQTVMTAQQLYAKAALIDHQALEKARNQQRLIDAENCLKDAFETDVRPVLGEWSESRKLAADPLRAFRESGYTERTARERAGRKKGAVSSYA